MNLETDTIYAGIAGVELDVDSFDLGDGLIITKSFGHFMAPFLMAFAPAAPGASPLIRGHGARLREVSAWISTCS